MFDATTAALLRSAPALPGLNPARIPALLTAFTLSNRTSANFLPLRDFAYFVETMETMFVGQPPVAVPADATPLADAASR